MIGKRPGGTSPPLGESFCPDPRWGAGRALVLVGPVFFIGPRWYLPSTYEGRPAGPPPIPPVPLIPPGVTEGSIPYVDELLTP